MQLNNTEDQFGVISKLLHWSIALLVIIEFLLVYWKRWILPEKSPLGGFFIGGLHKPIGILILYLSVLFIVWRFFNVHPKYPQKMPLWQKIAAHLNHFLLYGCIIIMPTAGILMSTAAGYPPNFFGLYQFPQFMDQSKELAGLFYNVHFIVGFVLMALVGIHFLAALKHHLIDRNHILKRMLP